MNYTPKIIAIAGAFVVFAAFAALLVVNATPNADEGFYAYSAYATTQGLMPYRDFGYTQMPLLPYVNGVLMRLTGFGVLEQRWINAGWSAAAFLVVAWALCRARVSPWVITAILMLWTSSIAAMYFSVVGKTYALAQFALVCAACSHFMAGRVSWRFVWLAFWGTVAVGTRLTLAPAVVVLWISLVLQHGRKTPIRVAAFAPLAFGAAALGPFIVADSKNFFFWTVDYHLIYAGTRRPLAALGNSVLLSPAIATAVVIALMGMLLARRFTPYFGIFAAGILGWILTTTVSGTYGEYAAPLWPLTLLGTGLHLDALAENRIVRWGAWIAIPVLAAAGISNPGTKGYRPWINPSYIHETRNAADVLRQYTLEDDVIIASMPEVPLQAGRRVPTELILGKFAVTTDFDEADASALHFLTLHKLSSEIVSRTPAAVVLTPFRSWSFGTSFPSLKPIDGAVYQAFLAAVASDYSLLHRSDSFYIFVRKEQPAATPATATP